MHNRVNRDSNAIMDASSVIATTLNQGGTRHVSNNGTGIMLKDGNIVADRGRKSDGNISKKRVRFLDKSLADELIQREKSQLEDRILALRQKYNFSKKAGDDSGDDEDKRDTVKQLDIVPRGLINGDRRPSSSIGFRTKQDTHGLAGGDIEVRTRRSYSLIRLDELAKPRGRSKSVSSMKKSTIITLSPDHLRLAIPQKSPRTMNQLKDLPADELDYLLQPKSLKEFYAMADMCSSSRSYSRMSCASTSPGCPPPRRHSAGNIRTRNTKVVRAATAITPPTEPEPPIPPKFKPSLKMAATGVISMSDKPKSNPQQKSSVAMQSWTNALSVRSPNVVTGRFQMPGGRVLRLRPRKPAWNDPTSVEDSHDGESLQSQTNSKEEVETNDTKKTTDQSSTPRKVENRNGTVVRYRVRPDARAIDVSQLTKDLSKCKYLRHREQDHVLDIKDIFKN